MNDPIVLSGVSVILGALVPPIVDLLRVSRAQPAVYTAVSLAVSLGAGVLAVGIISGWEHVMDGRVLAHSTTIFGVAGAVYHLYFARANGEKE